jgi:agmatinase
MSTGWTLRSCRPPAPLNPIGLTWAESLSILHALNAHATVVGIDCVELSPVAGLHMADFAVAKLLYKAISYGILSPF